MAENTKIEWADHTFNPWVGCQSASPEGCKHCYAEALVKRFGGDFAQRRRTSEANWKLPLKWNAQAEREGRRFRVFCASLADVFDNAVPVEWRRALFSLIISTPSLDWLLLTKRIGNAARMIDEILPDNMKALPRDCPLAWPWPNVWIGATVVNQAEADRDIPKLLATPAAVRFLSIEPMLGPIDLEQACDIAEPSYCAGTWDTMKDPQRCHLAFRYGSVRLLDWVICGGESGPHARPMHPSWARSLRDQCAAAGVPYLFKQWGEWREKDTGMPEPLVAREGDPDFEAEMDEHDGFLSLAGHFVTDPDDMEDRVPYRGLQRITKKVAGRLLDGRTHDEFPD